ncbi:hypothetical protein EC988_005428, partial [Linderina pennispora]
EPVKGRAPKRAPAANRGRSTAQSKTTGEPKKENPACITQLVADIARGLYAKHLINVTAYQTANPKQQQAGTDMDGGLGSDVKKWEKKYSSPAMARTTELKRSLDDKGKLLVEELKAHNVPMKLLRANTVHWPQESILPAPVPGRRYASEVHIDATVHGDDDSRTSGMVPIKIGDVVLVKAGGPKNGFTIDSIWEDFQASNSHGAGLYVKAVVVESIYSKRAGNVQMIHGRTLLPGRDTILGEVAAPHEWFLADHCGTYSIDMDLRGKLFVSFIPTEMDVDMEAFAKKNIMFCRFWYDFSQGMFEDVNLHKVAPAGSIKMWCSLCKSKRGAAIKVKKQVVPAAKIIDESGKQRISSGLISAIAVAGVTYHVHDVAYMRSHTPNHPFEIGYIKSIKSHGGLEPLLKVVVLRRMRDVPPALQPVGSDPDYVDDRHLFWTPKEMLINSEFLRGKCWVAHPSEITGSLNAYKDTDPNAFYAKYQSMRYTPKSTDDWQELQPHDALDEDLMPAPRSCLICRQGRMRREQLMSRFIRSPTESNATGEPGTKHYSSFACGKHPLRALDLFSGCGGITQGMDQSGVVKTKWAVEYMPSAGMTFARNHPHAQVYNQCSNLLLDSAIKAHHGIQTEPLINKFNDKPLPPMPQPGDVDFIYCGPPCQGFSRCNRFIKADDIKTSLIANALSYVDFYRPTYFLLENVRGLLDYKLGGKQVGTGRVEGGIKM